MSAKTAECGQEDHVIWYERNMEWAISKHTLHGKGTTRGIGPENHGSQQDNDWKRQD
jgi:hypothetical protein